MKNILLRLLLSIRLNVMLELIFERVPLGVKVYLYNTKIEGRLKFIAQGGYRLDLSGDLTRFSIDSTSHLK